MCVCAVRCVSGGAGSKVLVVCVWLQDWFKHKHLLHNTPSGLMHEVLIMLLRFAKKTYVAFKFKI